jgi:hypothetical protein
MALMLPENVQKFNGMAFTLPEKHSKCPNVVRKFWDCLEGTRKSSNRGEKFSLKFNAT